MLDKWIADAVGRMHVAEITGKRLAAECGYTESYLSTVLHGKKGCLLYTSPSPRDA